MSLLSTVTGLGPIFDIGGKILDRVIPNPEARAAANLELMKLAQTGELAQLAADTDLAKGQLEINKEEAKSANLFVAGWRPFIGWVCGGALALSYVVLPLGQSFASLFGVGMVQPNLNMGELMGLLVPMLGLGAMRTIEKAQGVATSVGGKVLTPVHKAQPSPGAVAPQEASATPPAPVEPVQPASEVEAPRKGWIR